MKKQLIKIAVVTGGGSSGIGLATAKELISEGGEVITTGGKVSLLEEAIQQLAGTIKNEIPVKRFGAPSDIAKLISFISSDNASFITDLEYIIDGGISSVPTMS